MPFGNPLHRAFSVLIISFGILAFIDLLLHMFNAYWGSNLLRTYLSNKKAPGKPYFEKNSVRAIYVLSGGHDHHPDRTDPILYI